MNAKVLVARQAQVVLTESGSLSQQSQSSLEAASALWKRVPTRDASGKRLSDLMIIFPDCDFKQKSQFDQIVDQIQQVLCSYNKVIVFADLNVKLKILWVSFQPIPGMYLEISTAIHARIPQARLVSHRV